MQQPIQRNASFWFAAAAYAICGTSLFFATSIGARVFTHMDDSFPIPIRVVMFIGPLGWLSLALLAAVATLCARSTLWRLVSTIVFSLLTVGVLCTVLFTSIDRPSRISASNPRASLDAAIAFSLFFGRHRGRASEPERSVYP